MEKWWRKLRWCSPEFKQNTEGGALGEVWGIIELGFHPVTDINGSRFSYSQQVPVGKLTWLEYPQVQCRKYIFKLVHFPAVAMLVDPGSVSFVLECLSHPVGQGRWVPIKGSLLLKKWWENDFYFFLTVDRRPFFLGHRFAPEGGFFAGARIPLQSQLG